jgi:hypothetical protein
VWRASDKSFFHNLWISCANGKILINNCTSLDAAIQARQSLIARLESALQRNAKPIEADAPW